jgi:uncharacterized protein (DUF697 family)
VVVALNKIDLVSRESQQVLEGAASALDLEPGTLTPLSAKYGTGIERLLTAIVKSEPELVAALGVALPAYRVGLARAAIIKAASTASAIALTPLPILDFFPLIAVQAALVLGIARIYAYNINLARARELLATFGVAWLGRTLFYELSKLGGPPGWVLAAGIAAGTTVALGYAAIAWFERGERLPRRALKDIIRLVSERLREELKNLGARRPGRAPLRARVAEILSDMDGLLSGTPGANPASISPPEEMEPGTQEKPGQHR